MGMVEIISDSKNREILLKVKHLALLEQKGIRHAFYNIGKSLVKESKALINKKPKSGRTYWIRKGNRRVRHRASAAGEAPAVITGNLRGSVDFKVNGSESLTFGSRRNISTVKSGIGEGFSFKGRRLQNIMYPKFLELGTSRIAPRPFLSSSIKNNYRNIGKYFEIEIKKAVKIL
jgi:hypothetical protein